MIIRRFPSGSFRWILPTLVVVLAALLGARVLVDWRSTRSASRHFAAPHAIVASTAPTHAPAATIPPPRHLTLADVPAPARWSRMMAISSLERLDFTIDLDRFAPLGDGPANAAIWFRDFANDDGSRAPEAGRSARMTVSLLGEEARVLAPDD